MNKSNKYGRIEDWIRVAKADWKRALCERVTGYYLAERYPPFGDLGLTTEVLEKDIQEVKRFIQMLFPQEVLNG